MSSLYHVKGEIITQSDKTLEQAFECDKPIEFETQSETFADLIERLIHLGMGVQVASGRSFKNTKINVLEIYVNHRW